MKEGRKEGKKVTRKEEKTEGGKEVRKVRRKEEKKEGS
jgi:hypothetical protein